MKEFITKRGTTFKTQAESEHYIVFYSPKVNLTIEEILEELEELRIMGLSFRQIMPGQFGCIIFEKVF